MTVRGADGGSARISIRVADDAREALESLVSQPTQRTNLDGFRACTRGHGRSVRARVISVHTSLAAQADPPPSERVRDLLRQATRWLEAVRQDPTRSLHGPAVVAAVATALAASGDRSGAERVRLVAQNLPDSSPAVQAQVEVCRGLEFLSQGEPEHARPHIRTATQLTTRMPAALAQDDLHDLLLAACLLPGPPEDLADLSSAGCDHEDPAVAAVRRHLRGDLAGAADLLARSAVEADRSGLTLRGDTDRLLAVALAARSGHLKRAAAGLSGAVTSDSQVLRGLQARLGLDLAIRSADPVEQGRAARRIGSVDERLQATDSVLARLDNAETGPLWDALTRLVVDRWREHARDLSTLAAHDLRGPAQNAMLAMELLQSATGRPPAAGLDSLGAAVEDLIQAAATLPVLTRQSSWRSADEEDGWVPLGSILDGLLPALDRRLQRGQRIALHLRDHAGNLELAEQDVPVVSVLVGNLVANAAAASAPGSQIVLSLGALLCAGQPVGGGRRRVLVAQVRDSGRGFDPALTDRLFGLGERGAAGTAPGHGLGLYIVDLAARRLGGCVWAHSDGPGTGATFVVHLPARGAVP